MRWCAPFRDMQVIGVEIGGAEGAMAPYPNGKVPIVAPPTIGWPPNGKYIPTPMQVAFEHSIIGMAN